MVVTLDLPLTVVQVKIYGARVRVDGMAKVAEIEAAEKEKMKSKVREGEGGREGGRDRGIVRER